MLPWSSRSGSRVCFLNAAGGWLQVRLEEEHWCNTSINWWYGERVDWGGAQSHDLMLPNARDSVKWQMGNSHAQKGLWSYAPPTPLDTVVVNLTRSFFSSQLWKHYKAGKNIGKNSPKIINQTNLNEIIAMSLMPTILQSINIDL